MTMDFKRKQTPTIKLIRYNQYIEIYTTIDTDRDGKAILRFSELTSEFCLACHPWKKGQF